MYPVQDYLLVEEVIKTEDVEGTNLKLKYDDTERFMYVKVVNRSSDLVYELMKMYPSLSYQTALSMSNNYEIGNVLIINRVAKTPYKEGMYFISIKDVIAVEQNKDYGTTVTSDTMGETSPETAEEEII